MAVPNIFATATTTIPLIQLDQNFATAITLGNTAVYLGNTTTTLGNLTLNGAAVNGTVGATTASTGAFTTLSSSGVLTVTDATQSTSTSTGSIITSGGVGIAKALQVGGTITGLSTFQSSSGADLSLNANGANRDIIGKINGTEGFRYTGSTTNFGVTGTLSASGDFAVATNKFTANATTGNIVSAGNLTLGAAGGVNSTSGSLSLSGTSVILRDTAFGTAFSTFSGTGQSLTGALTVSGTGVVGAFTSSNNANIISVTYTAGSSTAYVGTTGNNLTLAPSSGTTNAVLSATGLRVGSSTAPTVALDVTGAALISSTLGVTGVITGASFIPSSSSIPTNGMYLNNTNTIGFATNSGLRMIVDASGGVGIGTTNLTQASFRVVGTGSQAGTSQNAIQLSITATSAATGLLTGVTSAVTTAAAAYTCSEVIDFYATQNAAGAGSTQTNRTGFYVDDLTSGTNNYGFKGTLSSGANKYNLYMSGTADNSLNGNLYIGGATVARGTTQPTNSLTIFNGTAPVGTLTNGATFYAASGEMRVMDSAGNSTLLSPHDDDGNWIYDSVSPQTGKHLRIDMEKLIKAVNEKFGWDFVHECAIQ